MIGFRSAPRTARERPKSAEERPKSTQRAPKRPKGGSRRLLTGNEIPRLDTKGGIYHPHHDPDGVRSLFFWTLRVIQHSSWGWTPPRLNFIPSIWYFIPYIYIYIYAPEAWPPQRREVFAARAPEPSCRIYGDIGSYGFEFDPFQVHC